MLLRTLPLRTKLIAAMLIPFCVVAGFLGIQVSDGLTQRSNAVEQSTEIARAQAVIDYAAEVGLEGRVLASPTAETEDLARQRAAVDTAWLRVTDPAIGIDADEIAQLQPVADEVATLRSEVGSSPFLFRNLLSQRATQTSSGAGIAIGRFAQLQGNILEALDFDRSNLSDSSEAQAIAELLMVERMGANLSLEQATQLSVWSLAEQSLSSNDLASFRDSRTRTNESLAGYSTVASSDARRVFQEFTSSPEFVAYRKLQNAGATAQVGDSTDAINLAEVDRGITDVNAAFATFESAKSTEVETRAAQAVAVANDELIQAAALGGGLLFLVALILIGLYQSIRQPLRRLTEQSRRVAEHDLPEIVRAIRNGDMESVKEIETIEAYSIDELGDLVAAFNGMHRTAVDLAVEQAGSRRVVADMFVNLGRRNQKLLNRMLKGLTLLEREEEDPDKLAALYQVDHLATRMRRNAESLLILAGAPQARSWDQSVPIYDVINASLAEVENYDRVDVDSSEGELVKGEFVADLAHMLAELTENALAFSPPGSRVEVVAQQTRRGYAIIVNDRGIGMPSEAIAEANQRIADAGTQGETPSEFLGHFVVGRLAARNGFQVDLFEGATGISARILLPDSVFDRDESFDVPNDAAELFPMREHAVLASVAPFDQSQDSSDEPFATIPDSLDIDDEPFATVPDSLDIDDEPFATIPDSLGIANEQISDEPFATIPDSLDAANEQISDEPFATIPQSDGAVDEPIGDEEVADADVADALDAEVQSENRDIEDVHDIEDIDAVAHDLIDDEKDETIEPSADDALTENDLAPLADASQPLVSPDALPQRRSRRTVDGAPVPHRIFDPRESDEQSTSVPAPLLATPPAGLPQRIPAPAIVKNEPELVAANAFGVQRRKPGAQLPTTTIMPRAAAIDTDLDDPDAVRSSLSGFQSGTFRADKEND
jgi:signal transduction histidine kinase